MAEATLVIERGLDDYGSFENGCNRSAARSMCAPRQSGIATTQLADIEKKDRDRRFTYRGEYTAYSASLFS